MELFIIFRYQHNFTSFGSRNSFLLFVLLFDLFLFVCGWGGLGGIGVVRIVFKVGTWIIWVLL